MSISPIKSFNTTGPCFPEENYMLPVLSRLPEVTDLINQKYYFIIHAPRQSGKTTYLNLLTDKINSEGEMYCLCCSLESCNQILDDTIAITRIIAEINTSLKISGISILSDLSNTYNPLPQDDPSVHVRNFLNYLCVNLDKDLVVFFDEADCLTETPLITFLRQIRNGYNSRFRSKNSKFPRSLALIGMRDIRDYLVVARSGSGSTSAASPFNIKRKSLTFSNFTLTEIQSLYFQHTSASGQIFEPGAIEKAWYWSKGQPWLVNALALEAVVEILKNDYQKAITASLIDQAAHRIIMHRDTHIDSLMERLKEPRVINVMDSVFAGTPGKVLTNPDDRQYCLDLGLVVEDDNKNLQPANQIYSEVMSRMLTDEIQSALDDKIAKISWHNDEIIFMNDILKNFQSFWRQNAFTFPLRINQVDFQTREAIKIEINSLPLSYELNESDTFSFISRVRNALARQYDEAAYSLLLMSYLQKVVNSGAFVYREFSQGRGSVDLCVIFKEHKYLIEIKLFGQKSREESLRQLSQYLDTSGEKEGWLVIFDRDRNKSWEEKLTWTTVNYEQFTIHIVGC